MGNCQTLEILSSAERTLLLDNPIQHFFTWEKAKMLDKVKETKIWQEQVKKEIDIAKQWEEDWGYQLGYDQLGNEREAKQLPRLENVSLFNKENFPITEMKKIGRRVNKPSEFLDKQYRLLQNLGNERRKPKADFVVQ